MTIDSLRQRYPEFGFATYAFEAHGPVTVEVHAPDGSVFTRTAETEDEAWAGLFPAPPQPEPYMEPSDEPDTALDPDEGSIFD